MTDPVPLEPVLEKFAALSLIPRPSRQEARVCDWIAQWAAGRGLETRRDAVGNLIVAVPASAGCEGTPGVIIQSHVDMVCEKTPESAHDFTRDPIRLIRDGEWLRADGTTLGADNGIGVAMAMALAEDSTLERPPLELLFTIDEETGLVGASSLMADFIHGERLINLDSEAEGVFIIGCAGGLSAAITLSLDREAARPGAMACVLKAGGLTGGHSGIDIHLGRANAIKILAQTLEDLARSVDYRIAAFSGGSAHNAIPRDARATLRIDPVQWPVAREFVTAYERDFRAIYAAGDKATDPGLSLTIEPLGEAPMGPVFTLADRDRVLGTLLSLPHGALQMSAECKGVVETSCNLATASATPSALEILVSMRSLNRDGLDSVSQRVEEPVQRRGGVLSLSERYPPWTPRTDSPLLERGRALYAKLNGREPVVEVIHAGLECGILGDRCPGLDMLSFGPTIRDPHSPAERVNLPSVGRTWAFLRALVSDLAKG